MRYYNAIYLINKPPGSPTHYRAYEWRPGTPLVWLRFDNNRLTSYGMR